NTLMNHLIYTIDSDYVEPIHRLDQETVGLLIVAKNPLMKKILDRMLEEIDITRIYKAHVKALLPIKPQTIDKPIGKDKFHPNKKRISNTGQRAITHILSSNMVKENVCELEIKLDTGRTHQIRVHLAEIGHPVIGDPLYGDSTLRQLELHSYKIELEHPLTKECISVSLDDEIS
ncbi:RluA family pseudouridine synthase, partial [Staphylococcus warneri]|uniref:RluA family pseudouridine synthase n=1 Tax=Staphylococcus warneri TaxID=1292 RepID=UPI000D3FF702